MARFKHGFPVSSAVLVGYLLVERQADREQLIRLATAMVLCEEAGQDVKRMSQMFEANLQLATTFVLPDFVDAPTAWHWRFEGFKVIREAAQWVAAVIERQGQRDMGRGERANIFFQSGIILDAFKAKLKKEQQLAEDSIRKCLQS